MKRKSYQKKSSTAEGTLPTDAVESLLRHLRKACSLGADTFGFSVGPEACAKAGLPFPVFILITANPDLFRGTVHPPSKIIEEES